MLLSHCPPANTYTAQRTMKDVWNTMYNCKEQYLGSSILLYGHGDGGGGPTDQMIISLLNIIPSKVNSLINRFSDGIFLY